MTGMDENENNEEVLVLGTCALGAVDRVWWFTRRGNVGGPVNVCPCAWQVQSNPRPDMISASFLFDRTDSAAFHYYIVCLVTQLALRTMPARQSAIS